MAVEASGDPFFLGLIAASNVFVGFLVSIVSIDDSLKIFLTLTLSRTFLAYSVTIKLVSYVHRYKGKKFIVSILKFVDKKIYIVGKPKRFMKFNFGKNKIPFYFTFVARYITPI